MSEFELIATAAFGVEALVGRELSQLGYSKQKIENGRVVFWGDESAICRANLWLRHAERVLIKVGEFKATTFEELFQGTKALPWPDWLPEKANFPVNGKSIKSTLFSVPDCQAIVKKAVVERMKLSYQVQWFEENGPKYTIEVALLKDIATLTIDTSGVGLHKRGYRQLVGKAPLKETLAAGLVNLSRWRPEKPFIDPFCGTGTIPIEAALMGLNIAPGLKREFVSETWPNVKSQLWQEARQEAHSLIKGDLKLDIAGFDIDPEALSLARYHAKQAGVAEQIHFQQRPVNELITKKKYGYLICNPPYGERLEEQKYVESLYQEMGRAFAPLDTWSFNVLVTNPRFEVLFGRKSDKNRKLYNGRIECHFYQFFGPRPPRVKTE